MWRFCWITGCLASTQAGGFAGNPCTQRTRTAFTYERSGLQDDLLAVVLLVLEDVVPVRGLVEREAVGDDPRGVDLAGLDAGEQRLHVLVHVALPRPQGQAPVHPRAGRELVDQPAVDADDGDDAAAAAAQDRLPERVRALRLLP